MLHRNSTNIQEMITSEILKTKQTIDAVLGSKDLLNQIEQCITLCQQSISTGRKIIFAGNGGSAAEAQHLAAELVGRFKVNRRGLAALSLATDISALTAISNDYGYDQVFSRQLEALGQENDVVIVLSTSGNSPNILEMIKVAREKKIKVIGLTGRDGGKMKDTCDLCLIIPAQETANIQEMHLMIGHILCHAIEQDNLS